jgi:hypothetical protein
MIAAAAESLGERRQKQHQDAEMDLHLSAAVPVWRQQQGERRNEPTE